MILLANATRRSRAPAEQQQQRLASLWHTKGHLMRAVGLAAEGLACLKHASQLDPRASKHALDYETAKAEYRAGIEAKRACPLLT